VGNTSRQWGRLEDGQVQGHKKFAEDLRIGAMILKEKKKKKVIQKTGDNKGS